MIIIDDEMQEHEYCSAVFCSMCRNYDECEIIHPELMDEDDEEQQM